MIKTETLFILGAGASQPFGYPTGIELRNLIRRGDIRHLLVKALNYDNDEESYFYKKVDEFTDEFSKSSVYSIDFFLEERTEFMDVGKMAIAVHLIKCEEDETLRNSDNNWYMYLYDRLKSSFEDFEKNNIFFVTLNYDRSLEQFLFEALRSGSHKSQSECAEKLNKIPIVHLYGQLDLLPWQNCNGKCYSTNKGYEDTIQRIRNAKKNLHLISDERNVSESEEFKKAYALIKKAKIVYFLGFGFDETNLERLNIQLMKNKTVTGTALRLEISKQRWVKQYFKDKRNTATTINLYEMDVLSLLKQDLRYE